MGFQIVEVVVHQLQRLIGLERLLQRGLGIVQFALRCVNGGNVVAGSQVIGGRDRDDGEMRDGRIELLTLELYQPFVKVQLKHIAFGL